ncbi:hypothetical protein [Arthrobacter sp. NA-172]|uniref:hypothetical protein n=1 Tax=Arthrobacter sp. NA-172 TaxID=3367524 RepID=UPI003754AFAD
MPAPPGRVRRNEDRSGGGYDVDLARLRMRGELRLEAEDSLQGWQLHQDGPVPGGPDPGQAGGWSGLWCVLLRAHG